MSEQPSAHRLERADGESIDRTKTLMFEFEGRTITAFEGDTIASAMYAAGVRVFSRSFKYHRPRGLLCVSGQCPNCMVSVDGEPNVRSCSVLARDGMKVHRQNSWPSADNDFYSLIQSIDGFLPVGFYYKTFINWPIEWKRVEGRIRKITGIGSIDESLEEWRKNPESAEGHIEQEYLDTQVLVVGGGPSGMAAAFEASNLGAEVVLVDDQPELGGHLRYSDDEMEMPIGLEEGEYKGLKGFEVARRLTQSLSGKKNIKILRGAVAFGLYESNLIGIMQGETKLIRLRAEQVVVATGAHEYPAVFQNNDIPGVFLGRGLQKLVRLYGVRPGEKVLIVSGNDTGLSVARSLIASNISMAGYVDARRALPASGKPLLDSLQSKGVPVLLGHALRELRGGKGVSGAVVVGVDEAGKPIAGSEKRIQCDTVALDTGFESEASLLNQAGYATIYDELLNDFVPGTPKPSLHPCGEITGFHGLGVSLAQGTIAGLTAALDVLDAERASGEPRLLHAQSRVDSLGLGLAEMEKRYRDDLCGKEECDHRIPS